MFCTLISLLENSTFPKGILEHAAIPTILQNKLMYVVYTPTFMPDGKAMTYFLPSFQISTLKSHNHRSIAQHTRSTPTTFKTYLNLNATIMVQFLVILCCFVCNEQKNGGGVTLFKQPMEFI